MAKVKAQASSDKAAASSDRHPSKKKYDDRKKDVKQLRDFKHRVEAMARAIIEDDWDHIPKKFIVRKGILSTDAQGNPTAEWKKWEEKQETLLSRARKAKSVKQREGAKNATGREFANVLREVLNGRDSDSTQNNNNDDTNSATKSSPLKSSTKKKAAANKVVKSKPKKANAKSPSSTFPEAPSPRRPTNDTREDDDTDESDESETSRHSTDDDSRDLRRGKNGASAASKTLGTASKGKGKATQVGEEDAVDAAGDDGHATQKYISTVTELHFVLHAGSQLWMRLQEDERQAFYAQWVRPFSTYEKCGIESKEAQYAKLMKGVKKLNKKSPVSRPGLDVGNTVANVNKALNEAANRLSTKLMDLRDRIRKDFTEEKEAQIQHLLDLGEVGMHTTLSFYDKGKIATLMLQCNPAITFPRVSHASITELIQVVKKQQSANKIQAVTQKLPSCDNRITPVSEPKVCDDHFINALQLRDATVGVEVGAGELQEEVPTGGKLPEDTAPLAGTVQPSPESTDQPKPHPDAHIAIDEPEREGDETLEAGDLGSLFFDGDKGEALE